MIEAAQQLLAMPKPTWQEDTATRRELERLEEDIRRYAVAESYDREQAQKVGNAIAERCERIKRFTSGKRCGADKFGFWGR